MLINSTNSTQSKVDSDFYLQHIGSFTLLFFLSVINPAKIWENIPFSFAPVTVLLAHVLLFFKIQSSVGFRQFLKVYKVELTLYVVYQLLCLLSLYTNFHRYQDLSQFIQWGLTFPIVQSTLAAVLFLFFLPQSNSRFSLSTLPYSWLAPVAIVCLIAIMAFWQRIAPESAAVAAQYFVAGNSGELANNRSVFAVSTDLAAIIGIISLCCLLCAYVNVMNRQKVVGSWYLIVAVIALSVGIVSGERVFFLILLVAVAFAFFTSSWFSYKSFIFLIASTPFVAYGFAKLMPDYIIWQFRPLFPFLYKIHYDQPLLWHDFYPAPGALNGRIEIWNKALSTIQENLTLGVSNGGFRLLKENGEFIHHIENNTHNVFLQSAIDAGILGFFIIALLIYKIVIGSLKNKQLLILIMAIICSLLVDNFTDHSLPWIIIATYCAAVTAFCTKKSGITTQA